ncbi:MAG: hypothetical protein AM325_004660 [Candidatus Thorarchaeota archaeon SMTZ1-45]|nr:MAG: hypothetical protein AM325_06415 [Candidatus Thorarchaeota archaeon SMTZ1-45]
MNNFYPVSPLVGITNTSYGAQVGVMDEMWSVRVVRGKKIIAEKTIPDLDLENIVGVAYGHIRVEGLSRHAVAMMAGRLMQFARKYQTAGVCPNYEIPDLAYDDGTTIGEIAAEARGEVIVTAEDTAPSGDLPDMRIGEIPVIPRTTGEAAWASIIESHATMICEAAIYASELPKGHLEIMFNRIADALIQQWVSSSPDEPSTAVMKFGALIQACSDESQLPKTGAGTSTIETGVCRILSICRNLDPSASRISGGYPCTFHEIIAKKLSELTGANISVNTSSTGCIVSISLQ